MKSKYIFTLIIILLLAGLVVAASQKNTDTGFVYDWENRQAPVPDRHIFQTKYLEGTQVIFDHDFHVSGLELECIECHHVEGCSHCHKKEVTIVDVQESKVALHKTCYTCHEDMTCVECHKQ
ncbi:cytochrome c family protein [bacterium]|nr:cytochrome c family protein [bacterium]